MEIIEATERGEIETDGAIGLATYAWFTFALSLSQANAEQYMKEQRKKN